MSFRIVQMALLAIGLAIPVARAQVPIEFGSLERAAALSQVVRNAVVTKATDYPFVGFRILGRDSVLLVFEDSTLTLAALRAKT